jgi:twitching motility two-component system response regulator PilH
MAVTKVLVCDDSITDLTNIKQIVETAGCMTVTASSGAEALDKAKSEKPDLIFLDIIMPEMDGFEACRKLHDDPTTKDIPVVFVTSKHQKADRVWAQMQGASDFISKPYTADQIAAKLAKS